MYEKIVNLWHSFNITTPADLDMHLDNFRILFAYNSSKIENPEITYHDTRDIFTDGRVTGFSGTTRTIFELENQKICYEALKSKIIRKEPLSLDLIKEIHKLLTRGTYDSTRYLERDEHPGEFKKHDYVVGINDIGSAPEDVESDLSELIAEISNYKGSALMAAATYLHAQFEFIHPFADGNGRVGRTLLNYYLMTHNHPPLIIYETDKKDYYACLQRYDELEELNPLQEFFHAQLEKTWAKALDKSLGNSPKRSSVLGQIQSFKEQKVTPQTPANSPQKTRPIPDR